MMLKSAKQTEQEQLHDRIFAAMETGNHGQARTLLTEYREFFPESAEAIRADVIAEYGVAI